MGMMRLLPKGSCDCHSHLYPPYSAFALRPAQHHEANADIADYLAICASLGVDRHVLVQGKAYPDRQSLLYGMHELGTERVRGIVFFDPAMSDQEFGQLDTVGVCGFRYLFRAGEAVDMDAVRAGAQIAAKWGWHIILQAEGPALIAHYADLLALPCPVVIDHLGRPPRGSSVEDAAFQALLDFLRGGGWIKLASPYNVTLNGSSDFSPLASLVRALLDTEPSRLIWGLNFPHPNLPTDGKPDERHTLTSLLAMLKPNETQQIFVENPGLLYKFSQN